MTQGANTATALPPRRPLSVDGVRRRPAKTVDGIRTPESRKAAPKLQLIDSRPSTTAVVKSAPKPTPLRRSARPVAKTPTPATRAPSQTTQPAAAPAKPKPQPKSTAAPAPAVKTAPKVTITPTHSSQSKKARRQQIYIALALLAGGVGGFLVQAVWFGVAAIAVYGLMVFILRVPSRTTFALAGVSIATISSLFLFKPSPELASNFATYTFMLLVIGVISLARESRSPSVRGLPDRNRRY